MPPFPVAHGGIGHGQTFATSTYGTTLTASASVDTKGTPVELIASTAFDAHWLEVMTAKPGTTSASYAVDILIGAATEAVLAGNLTCRARAADEGGGRWLFPVFVPKGSRIAASVASSTGSATMLVAVNLFNAGIATGGLPGDVVQYGTITNSLGVNVDPGGVAHTDSAWVEITAATVRNHNWLVLTFAHLDVSWLGDNKWLIDVGIGAATETVLVSDIPFGGSTTNDYGRPDMCANLPVFVVKGSRLTVRARALSITDGDRDLYVTLHGAG